MIEKKSAGGTAQGRARSTRPSTRFTADEQAAMRERAREAKATLTGNADGESDVLAKIAEMPELDRAMAEGLHAIIKASAPALV